MACNENDLSKDLIDVTLALSGQMLVQGGKADTLKQGITMAQANILNGKALKKFRQMVTAQGGDVSRGAFRLPGKTGHPFADTQSMVRQGERLPAAVPLCGRREPTRHVVPAIAGSL